MFKFYKLTLPAAYGRESVKQMEVEQERCGCGPMPSGWPTGEEEE